MIGRTLGHYRIESQLGEGGAIKILRPEVMADSARKRRFIQEARAASALNHPKSAWC